MIAPSTLGAYRLIAELGHGGMADVFLAAAEGPTGSGFTKLAVIKKLRSHLADEPEFISMLMDEARVTARLSHPNVVQLFEVGQTADEYFLAMEFLEGQPLHRASRRLDRLKIDGKRLPREIYYTVISDVLAGLQHAHELSDYDGTPLDIVHRDVTPHNVFVTYDGQVKVVDFGIAKAVGRLTETQHGVVKGKIRYMSPEQAEGGEVDRRTDIFAVGVMLWNLATGMKLWGEGGDRGDIEVAHALYAGDYPASPRAVCPSVPPEIDSICQRALAFHPEARYQTAAEMRADLEAFIGRRDAEARRMLTSCMKKAFARERAKLRSVLENARLATVPSTGGWKVAAGFEPVEHTELIPLAPTRTFPSGALPVPADHASLFAMELAPTEHDGVAPALVTARSPADERSGGSRRRWRRSGGARRFGGMLAAVALGVVVGSAALLGTRPGGFGAGPGTPAPARAPAVIAVEPTPLADDPRTKVQRSERAAKTDAPAPAPAVASSHAPRKPAVTASAGPRAPALPTATAHPVAGPIANVTKGALKAPPLDNSDPWSDKR